MQDSLDYNVIDKTYCKEDLLYRLLASQDASDNMHERITKDIMEISAFRFDLSFVKIRLLLGTTEQEMEAKQAEGKGLGLGR